MQAELKVIGGKQQGKIIPLTMKKFLIGREKDCHLRPNNDLISRHHCVLTVDEYTVRIRDLGSTNGTMVNSERIQGQVVLKDGDQLSFGKLTFEISIRQPEGAAAETLSPTALDETDAFTSRPTPIPDTISTDSPTVATDVTSMDIPIPVQGDATGSGVYGGDTVMIPAQASDDSTIEQAPVVDQTPVPQQQAPIPPQEAPAAPPADPPVPGVPPGQFMPQQGMPQQGMPQQYPPQQFVQQPMPMMPQHFMQPQMPMMPQQFVQPQMPMMPQPVQMAPQPYPTEIPGAAQPPQPPAGEVAPVEELDVRLPPPEETGAQVVDNQPSSTDAPSSGAETTIDPRVAAADIIRQYTHRPSGE